MKKFLNFKILVLMVFTFCLFGLDKVNASSCVSDLEVEYSNYLICTSCSPKQIQKSNSSDSAIVDVSKYQGLYVNILFSSLDSFEGKHKYSYCFTNKLSSKSPCITSSYSTVVKSYYNVLIPNETKYLVLLGNREITTKQPSWINNVSVSLTEEYCPPQTIRGMTNSLNSGINPFSFLSSFKTLLPWVITLIISFLGIYLLKKLIGGVSDNGKPKF